MTVVINDKTLQMIRKACKSKKNLKLTVGYVRGAESGICVINEHGEMEADREYRYEIGSITKTFTTSLLAKYVSENRMSLTDSIHKYVEGLTEEKYYPTLFRLATHTSGYSGSLPFNKRENLKLLLGLISGGGDMKKRNPFNVDIDKMKALIERHPLKNKDYAWEYSNFGLALIGYALGAASGRGYWSAMNDFVQHELELTHTWLGNEKANLHGYDSKNNVCDHWQWGPNEIITPAGGLSSTAGDLLNYATRVMGNDQPYLATCTLKHANGKGKRYDMGLGWWLLRNNNNIFWHGGGTGCFSTFLGGNREKKTAAVVLANYRMGFDADQKIGFSLLESL
ncbi:serine hydrolase [Cohnella sp. AR92]|uniref:serine hydrolase domain-containing protein n=1 Tax=Cohnella sp. AR92 TaxID=648716 RepID=UPI000F8CBFD0|nr:serine hydrolase domain-containing protein [Cohnella sp. AR92]RUS48862.1 class A beta-lactamase-related serine hydrolase [Cohnella sp. AR92]